MLSLKRQKESPKKPQPLKPKPSIIIQSSTSVVPPNSLLGLFNDNDASTTFLPAPTLVVDAEPGPTTATTSSNTTLLTLPDTVRLEIIKHLGDQQQKSSFVKVCEEWNQAVEGSKKVAVDSAPSEPENSVGQESEEAEAEEGEIDEMGLGVVMGMEGVEELGEGEGGGGGLNKAKFKASFKTIASSDPSPPAESEHEMEEETGKGMEMEMEEVEG